MSMVSPFQEQGKTIAVNPSGTSQNVPVVTKGQTNVNQIKIFNNSNQVCFLAFGTDNSVAAAIPIVNTPAFGMPIAMGEDMVITNPRGADLYVAVIAGGTATGNLYITPGEGG